MTRTSTIARSHYEDQKERIGAAGRDPESVKMLPMAYAVVGETRAQAQDREQLLLNDLVDPMASLTLLSELMNYDFSGWPWTTPSPTSSSNRCPASVDSCRTSARTSVVTQ